MKRLIFLYFILFMSVIFSSCSKDELISYETPVCSLADFHDQMNFAKSRFLKKHPYAINYLGNSYQIRAVLKDDPQEKPQTATYYFNKRGRCGGVQIQEFVGKETAMDRFYELLEIVNKFTTKVKSIRIVYTEDNYFNIKKAFSSMEELKDWIATKDINENVSLRTIQTEWHFPEGYIKYSERDKVCLVLNNGSMAPSGTELYLTIGEWTFNFV